MLEDLGLRRRLAEDSQPHQRWACACPGFITKFNSGEMAAVSHGHGPKVWGGFESADRQTGVSIVLQSICAGADMRDRRLGEDAFEAGACQAGDLTSAFGDALVEIEDGAGDGVPSGEFGGGEGFGEFDAGAEFFGGFGICFGRFELGSPEGFEDGEFLRLWCARQREAEGVLEAGVEVGAGGFGDDAFGEGLGGADVNGVVEEGEGLERGVAARAADDAGHAGAGVEIHEAGIGRAALEDDVEAPAILLGSGADDVVVLLAADFLPEAVGLWRTNGRAALFEIEEARDGEGVVADGFGIEAEAGAVPEEGVGRIDRGAVIYDS